MKNIKWVFFDIDNTLFDSRGLSTNARKNAVKAMIKAGLNTKFGPAFKKLLQIVKKYGSNYPGHFDKLVQAYKVKKEERSRIVAAGIVEYHNTKFRLLKPFPGVKKTLEKLKASGYKLGIITNGRATKQWDKLIRLNVSKFFDIVVISEEVGSEKPSKKIFRTALKKAKCRAREAVMIGDKPEDMAAEKIGMHTVMFKGRNFTKLINETKKIENKK
ncbi:TPA: TIGR02253 family HAD-type hydrolase [archaeon]|uniref:Glyceraldehyde 3-phosphate phosphatase n=1 Tax=Candidatus Naiadarchaeum limnaeum TaxID=2756139 RepID=A0A832XJ37_9ARCH|nr:TIGR02253 family HAD-type hydrolase [Candidatus Naiadarchaeales archaeon SRR2090153.bin1042]HIK00052.1 TIGR02253 family HAD-type hydrolase [Candidatus Naiadarchaeum limnaeum]